MKATNTLRAVKPDIAEPAPYAGTPKSVIELTIGRTYTKQQLRQPKFTPHEPKPVSHGTLRAWLDKLGGGE